jgi:hypothetical protein
MEVLPLIPFLVLLHYYYLWRRSSFLPFWQVKKRDKKLQNANDDIRDNQE